MSERSVRILFEGIISSIDKISLFTAGVDKTGFLENLILRDAVLMQLLVIGETANRVPTELRSILPDVEWGRIVRSRNIIAHNYHGIDYEIIWKIITDYLPPLKVSLEAKLSELEP